MDDDEGESVGSTGFWHFQLGWHQYLHNLQFKEFKECVAILKGRKVTLACKNTDNKGRHVPAR